MTSPMQTDTTQITTEIKQLITSGVREREPLTRVMRTFPNLTSAELSAALRDATAAAEKQAMRRH